jgi:hypothetical protein
MWSQTFQSGLQSGNKQTSATVTYVCDSRWHVPRQSRNALNHGHQNRLRDLHQDIATVDVVHGAGHRWQVREDDFP